MKMKTGLPVLTFFFACLFSIAFLPVSGVATPEKTDKGRTLESYGKLPLYFIENKGQVDSKVRFYVKTPGQTLYFTDEGIVFDLFRKKAEASKDTDANEENKRHRGENKAERLVFSLLFDKANKGVSIAGLEKQEAKVNYLLGSDKAAWKTNIPICKGIFYKEVYKGIDFKVEGKGQAIKYEFIVNPEGNTGDIRLTYHGIEALSTNGEGELLIETAFGELKETKPYIYQEKGGRTTEVHGGFRIQKTTRQNPKGKSSYGFHVAAYDPSYPLIIDPTLVYSTYLGGSSLEEAGGIAIDISGNAYVTGTTQSNPFPTKNAYQKTYAANRDAFITKLSSTGNALTYSTYLGGSSDDYGYGIAVDTSGNAYVSGTTSSNNFPTKSAYQGTYTYDETYNTSVAFITKLSSTGSALSYSTFLGGNDGPDCGAGIAVDSSGNAYVTGETDSSNFPTKSAYQKDHGGNADAFISKLSSAGSALTYSTYLGGSGDDYGYGIALDSDGNAYIGGYTASTNFPTNNAYQKTKALANDAFITKLSSAGDALTYSTFLGGRGGDEIEYDGIAVDASGNAYVAGRTGSNDFPTKNAYQGTYKGAHDAFITKLSSSGDTLSYSTYLGGTGSDYGYGIAIDTSGNAYVTGYTASDDFPTNNPSQSAFAGATDAFITKLSSSGNALTYSTYLGGDSNDYGYGITVDSSGSAYVSGKTKSTDFPTKSAYQGSKAGSDDAFVLKYQGTDSTPTVTTLEVTSISTTTATGNGNITDLGSPNPTAHGVCWNTSGTPTISDNIKNKGAASATGAFTASMTGLAEGTTYYVRAYATNSAGTSYGGQVSFSTYYNTPTITSFTPTSGGTGTSVTITGTNFTRATAVKFGGTAASSFTVDSATQVTAVVGSGATGKVTVTTPGGDGHQFC